jgi:hypothetical protein
MADDKAKNQQQSGQHGQGSQQSGQPGQGQKSGGQVDQSGQSGQQHGNVDPNSKNPSQSEQDEKDRQRRTS